MKAMILAAGLGTRLRPLTEKTPKALLLVADRPLIEYGLRLLKKYRLLDVVINLHHQGRMIERELEDGRKFGMQICYSWEEEILGTGGGIKRGAQCFEGEPLVVINSDILIDVDLESVIRFHQQKKGIATMVVRPLPSDAPHTPIELTKGDRIARIGGPREEQPLFMYTGVQILEPQFLSHLPEGKSYLVEHGYLPALQAGEKVYGFRYEGYWNDLGTLDALRQAERDLKEKRGLLSYLE